jgi:hypothetical protein
MRASGEAGSGNRDCPGAGTERVQGNLKSSLLKHNNDFTACKAQLMAPSPKFTLTLSYIVTMQGVAKIKKPKKWETPCMILSFR